MKSYAMHSSMLYEYTALSEQAKDAMLTRNTYMRYLAESLVSLSERPEMPFDETEFVGLFGNILKVDTEMRTALERANQAAKLCGKPELTLAKLLKS